MATRKLYKCHRPTCQAKNHGQFWQEADRENPPVCPQCNLSALDPKFGDKIQRLVVVHFDPPSEFPGTGLQVRACDPKMPIQAQVVNPKLPSWHAGTGNPKTVNCDLCKATDAYKAAAIDDDGDAVEKVNAATKAAFERLEPLKQLR